MSERDSVAVRQDHPPPPPIDQSIPACSVRFEFAGPAHQIRYSNAKTQRFEYIAPGHGFRAGFEFVSRGQRERKKYMLSEGEEKTERENNIII